MWYPVGSLAGAQGFSFSCHSDSQVGKDSAVAGVAVLYAEVAESSEGPTGRAQDRLCGGHQAHGLWESSPAVPLSPGDSSHCEERCLQSTHLEMTRI